MIPKLPMANCAHFRYEGTHYGCAKGGACEPAKTGVPMEMCQRGYVRVNRRDGNKRPRAISKTKPKISIQEMATRKD